MIRSLVVGEAPNRIGDPLVPIAGACGRRLADLAGVSFETFLRSVARANVLDAWPGSARLKGAAFPISIARRRAVVLRRRFVGARTVVLLGRRVASAFDLGEVDYFEATRVGSATVVVVPHPSGVNRWYNDLMNRRRAGRFMRRVVREGLDG